MKTFCFKNKFFNKVLLVMLLVAGVFFAAPTPKTTYASEGYMFIAGPDTVLTTENNFQLTAILRGSTAFNAANVVWSFEIDGQNNSSITIIESPETNHSVAEFKNELFSEHENKIGTATAVVRSGTSVVYEAVWQVLFVKPETSVAIINSNNDTQVFNPEGEYEAFELNLNSNSNIKPNSAVWMMSLNNNKFVTQENTSQDKNTFSFTPEKPGTYLFKASFAQLETVDGEEVETLITTEVLKLTVGFKQFDGKLQLSKTLVKKDRNGLHTYLFELENLQENIHDTNNINWYRDGHAIPLQYGGSSFLFKPNTYATYHIYAKYDGVEDLPNQSIKRRLEIKIDRTKEILYAFIGFVGVLAVGLVFVINRKIKNDKVW